MTVGLCPEDVPEGIRTALRVNAPLAALAPRAAEPGELPP